MRLRVVAVIMSETQELQDCTAQPWNESLQSGSHPALFYSPFNRVIMTEDYLGVVDPTKKVAAQL